jgi:hypothetical protein
LSELRSSPDRCHETEHFGERPAVDGSRRERVAGGPGHTLALSAANERLTQP